MAGNLFNIADIRDKVDVNICDVRDLHAMKHLIQGKDFLFNLAGQTSHMDSMSDPQTDLDINASAQLSILEACRQNNPEIKIVFASTRQLYGKPDYLPVDEKHRFVPLMSMVSISLPESGITFFTTMCMAFELVRCV